MNDPRASDPKNELLTFIRTYARNEPDGEHTWILIQEALNRFDRPLMKNSDIALKSKNLAKSATAFAKDLRRSLDIQLVAEGMIAREGENSLWQYLRITELIGGEIFGDDIPGALRFGADLISARRFGVQVGKPLGLLQAVETTAKQARSAVKAYSRRGSPKNLRTSRLKGDLAILWNGITGKKCGASKATTYDTPRTLFAKFMKYCLETTDWSSEERQDVFRAIASVEGTKRRK